MYAQVAARLPNAPIAQPSIDKVVYATVHASNVIKALKLIHAYRPIYWLVLL